MTDKYKQTSSMLPLDPKIHFISCDGVPGLDSDTVTVTARARRAAGRPSSEGPCRARPPDGRPLPVAVPISKSTPNYS